MNRLAYIAKRAAPLLKLASEYTTMYIATRLMAAASSLLLVRLLPVVEYGFYTLLLSAFTFICTFSDLGSTETLSLFRRRANKKNKPWIQYFFVVMRFRKIIFIFSFSAASIYVIVTGHQVGTNWEHLLIGTLLMGFGSWFSIQSGINTYVLKLGQHFRAAYAVDISAESVKLLVAGLIWLLGLTTALVGMAGVATGALVGVLLSYKLLNQPEQLKIDLGIRRRNQYTKILLNQIIPTLPGSIHYAMQGVIVAGLAAYYGSVVNVAELGALGRLGVLIGLVSGFTGSVFLPRLLAVTNERIFFMRYLQWWVAIVLYGFIILIVIGKFHGKVLWLLGGDYSALYQELLVSGATAIVATWLGYSFAINRAKGWVRFQPYSVPFILFGQLILFFFLDMSTTSGVLWFAFGGMFVSFIYQLMLNIAGFLSEIGGANDFNRH